MAIPFNVPRQQISGDATAAAHQHYLRIENLLMELLSMLRWTPWATMYDALQSIQRPANEALEAERRLAQRLQRQRQREQQLPDLVTSNMPMAPAAAALVPDIVAQAQHVVDPAPVVVAPAPVVAAPAPVAAAEAPAPIVEAPAPAPAPVVALVPVATGQAQAQEIIVVKKTYKNLLLQVQLCPRSLNSGRMRVFVVKKKVRSNGNGDNSSDNQHAEAQVVVRQRSMFDGLMSDIPSCILTAAFVLIGFKMFMRQ